MPNGKYEPRCHICQNLLVEGNLRRCGKHKIIIPRAGSEKLCRDWMLNEAWPELTDHPIDRITRSGLHRFSKSKTLQNLKRGILYQYSSQWPDSMTPLAEFAELKKPMFEVHILKHPIYQYAARVKDSLLQENLQSKGPITLRYNEHEATYVLKTIEMKITLRAKRKYVFWGKWIRQEGIINISALVNTDDKENILKTFLEEVMDLDKYENKGHGAYYFFLLDIPAFIQEHEENVYNLKPDILYIKTVGCSK